MPELKTLTISKTYYGWDTIVHSVGYELQEGELAVMIRRHFPNSPSLDPIPGWSSLTFSGTNWPVTVDWSTVPFKGYLSVQCPQTVFAIYKNGRIGNFVADLYNGGSPPGDDGAPFRVPPVPFTSENSIVLALSVVKSVVGINTGRIDVVNPDTGVAAGYTSCPIGIEPGFAISTDPMPVSPNIDVWVRNQFDFTTLPLTLQAYAVEIVDGIGPSTGGGGGGADDIPESATSINTCRGIVQNVGGVLMSTNDFVNAQELINQVGSDDSDPIADEYEGYIANGKNTRGTTGIQEPLPKQTELPDPSPIKPAETDNYVKDTPAPNIQGCTTWTKGQYDVPMSTNFILRNFTVGYPDKAKNLERGCLFPNQLIDLDGYDAQTRFCNLQALAQNVLEPIWAKFGPFRINSGIRNQNSVKNGVSQHVTGEAVDIQFPGWNYEMYWANAKWIKDNIPFDQFIYEHSPKTGLVWYHLSFRRSGNRPATDKTKVMTMYRGKYDPGLRRYG